MVTLPSIPLGIMVPFLAAVGAWLLWSLAGRATHDRQLQRIVLISYGLRVLLSVALFAISYWHWPILTALQVGRGFWMFAVDSYVYHDYGIKIAEAWANGIELPNPELGFEYFGIVAAIYRLCGAHPLYPILLNCWLAACNGLFAYLIGTRLGDRRTALSGAALVGFWPSTLLWSSQLLKDALSWFLVFSVLWLVLTAMPRHGGRRRGTVPWLCLSAGLGIVEILLTRLRFYVGSAVSLASLVTLIPAGGYAFFRKDLRKGLKTFGIVLVVVVSTVFARTLDLFTLFAPAHPEAAHIRLALYHRGRDDLDGAEVEFHRALRLNRRDPDVYLGLASVFVQQRRFSEALEIYATCLSWEEDHEKRLRISQLITELYVDRGNEEFEDGLFAEAASTYDFALRFAPSSSPLYANLGRALARQGKVDIALGALDKALAFATTPDQRGTILTEQARIGAEEHLRIAQERLRAHAERARAAQKAPPAPNPALPQDDTPKGSVAPVPPPSAISEALPSSPAPNPALPQDDTPKGSVAPVPPPSAISEALFHEPRDTELVAMARALFPGNHETSRGDRIKQVGATLTQLRRHVLEMDEQAVVTAQETTPGSLGSKRQGFVGSGGHSLVDAWAQISTPQKLVTYLPRALAVGLLAPFPWQWFDTKGSTGVMRVFAGAEMLFFYLLIPWVLAGTWTLVRRRRADGFLLLTYVLGLSVPLSLVVANVGTLFRLRLLFLLPLLVVAAQTDPVAFYRRVCRRVIGPLPSEPLDVAAGRQGAL